MNWLFDAFNRILPSKAGDIVMDGDDAWVLNGGEREENKIVAPCRISKATMWPKAQVYHLNLTPELVSGLRERLTERPSRELCDHLHIHHEGKLLCQGFDAGWEPLFVSISIPESMIASFCERAGYTYRLEAAI